MATNASSASVASIQRVDGQKTALHQMVRLNGHMAVTMILAILCIWALLTQLTVPRHLDRPLLAAQACAMAIGLIAVFLAPAIKLPLTTIRLRLILWLLIAFCLGIAGFGAGRTLPAIFHAWTTLSLLVFITLQLRPVPHRWYQRFEIPAAWFLLIATSLAPYGTHVILVPLLALAILLPLWQHRCLLAGLDTLAVFTLLWQFILSVPWRLRRVFPFLFSDPPEWATFYLNRVRHMVVASGWTGHSGHIPYLPNATLHQAFALFISRWGWAGSLIWFGVFIGLLLTLLVAAFRRRNTLAAGMLVMMVCVMLLVTLCSAGLTLGITGYGVAIPLLGLDPGLTILALFSFAIGERLRTTQASSMNARPDSSAIGPTTQTSSTKHSPKSTALS